MLNLYEFDFVSRKTLASQKPFGLRFMLNFHASFSFQGFFSVSKAFRLAVHVELIAAQAEIAVVDQRSQKPFGLRFMLNAFARRAC